MPSRGIERKHICRNGKKKITGRRFGKLSIMRCSSKRDGIVNCDKEELKFDISIAVKYHCDKAFVGEKKVNHEEHFFIF